MNQNSHSNWIKDWGLANQWFKDGAPIDYATNRVFGITSVQLDDASAYSVRVSNAGAFQERFLAELMVVP